MLPSLIPRIRPASKIFVSVQIEREVGRWVFACCIVLHVGVQALEPRVDLRCQAQQQYFAIEAVEMKQSCENFQRWRAARGFGALRSRVRYLSLCRDCPAELPRSRILLVKLLGAARLSPAQQTVRVGVANHPFAKALQRIALPELPQPQNPLMQSDSQPQQLRVQVRPIRSLPLAQSSVVFFFRCLLVHTVKFACGAVTLIAPLFSMRTAYVPGIVSGGFTAVTALNGTCTEVLDCGPMTSMATS